MKLLPKWRPNDDLGQAINIGLATSFEPNTIEFNSQVQYMFNFRCKKMRQELLKLDASDKATVDCVDGKTCTNLSFYNFPLPSGASRSGHFVSEQFTLSWGLIHPDTLVWRARTQSLPLI